MVPSDQWIRLEDWINEYNHKCDEAMKDPESKAEFTYKRATRDVSTAIFS